MKKWFTGALRQLAGAASALADGADGVTTSIDSDGEAPEDIAEQIIADQLGVDPHAPLDEVEEAEEEPYPLLRLVGSDAVYSMDQLLTDFEGFGLYDVAILEPFEAGPGFYPSTVEPLALVRDRESYEMALDLVAEAPDGLQVSLGALFSDRFLTFTPIRQGVM